MNSNRLKSSDRKKRLINYLYVTMASAIGNSKIVPATAIYSDTLTAHSLAPPPSLSSKSFHSSLKSIEYILSIELRYFDNVLDPSGTTKNFR